MLGRKMGGEGLTRPTLHVSPTMLPARLRMQLMRCRVASCNRPTAAVLSGSYHTGGRAPPCRTAKPSFALSHGNA